MMDNWERAACILSGKLDAWIAMLETEVCTDEEFVTHVKDAYEEFKESERNYLAKLD